MFQITVKTKKGAEKTVACLIDACTIGKGDENLVALQGWSMGRLQATLRRRPAGMFVEDSGTSLGTEVNGQRVAGEHGPLAATDVIKIGDYLISVMVEAPASAEPVASTGPVGMAADVTAPAAALVTPAPAVAPIVVEPPYAGERESVESFQARARIHKLLIQQMDLRRFDMTGLSEEALREKTRVLVEDIIVRDESLPASLDRAKLSKSVLDEAIGLGCLEDLLADDSITEIMVNRFDQIFIERKGRLMKSPICFTSDQAVLSAIERIVAPLGRRIDESSPMVDARLQDGSRVNAVIPPLALKGCNLTIRKFSKNKLVANDLVNYGSISQPMVDFMKIAVEQRRNVIISGGTGSGKTTLLNVLSNYIPDDQRIITCEDAAELQLSQSNLISLESRPANAEGKGAVPIRDLVKNCLRMRPDRIVIGECRGGEALDMLQAMNTGHDGSLTTVHANTPRDAVARIETMVMMAGMDLPITAIREQIQSAVHLMIQQSRFHDGTRKVTHITEVTGMENGLIQLQDIFRYKQEGMSADGKILGRYVATGAIPEFYEDLRRHGVELDLGIFAKPERHA